MANGWKRVVRLPNWDEQDKSFQRYAAEIGRLVYEWNGLHEDLANLFWDVLEVRNAKIPLAIWQSLAIDRAQRKMLQAVVAEARAHDKSDERTRLLDGVGWILRKVEQVAEIRNDAVHAPIGFVGDDEAAALRSLHHYGNKRALNLKDKDLLVEIRFCHATCAALRSYARSLRSANIMAYSDLYETEWPVPPELPTRARIASELKAENE